MRFFKTFGIVGLAALLFWASVGRTVQLRACRGKCCAVAVPICPPFEPQCHESNCCKSPTDGATTTKCPRNCCEDVVYRFVLDNFCFSSVDICTTADWDACTPTLVPFLAQIQHSEITFSWGEFPKKHPPPRSGQKRRLEMCSLLC